MIGDEQRANCAQNYLTTSEQEFPKTIGDELHKKSAQNLSNGIKTRNPIANRQRIALEKELSEQKQKGRAAHESQLPTVGTRTVP